MIELLAALLPILAIAVGGIVLIAALTWSISTLMDGLSAVGAWLDHRYATVEDYERHKAAKRAKRIAKEAR